MAAPILAQASAYTAEVPPPLGEVELCVTRRCFMEDLRVDVVPGTSLADLQHDHDVIGKFVAVRQQSPEGLERIRSIASQRPVYSLHYGRYRGATWHDRRAAAVWLLGWRIHKEGDRDDAYRFFGELDAAGHLFPTSDDYEALFQGRDARIIPAMVTEIAALVDAARHAEEHGVEHTCVLTGGVQITVLVVRETIADDRSPVEGLEELYLAVRVAKLEAGWLNIIRAAILPEFPADSWEFTRTFPSRGQSTRELRFRHCHDFVPTGAHGGD